MTTEIIVGDLWEDVEVGCVVTIDRIVNGEGGETICVAVVERPDVIPSGLWPGGGWPVASFHRQFRPLSATKRRAVRRELDLREEKK